MSTKEVTQEDIAKLAHQAKIAFAARCIRSVWNDIKPHVWKSAPKEVEDVLCELERLGAQLRVADADTNDKSVIGKNLHLVNACMSSGTPFACTLAEAILAGIETARLPFMPMKDDQKAAEKAFEVYCKACKAVQDAGPKFVPAEKNLRDSAKRDYDKMIEYFKENQVPTGAFDAKLFKP